MWVHLNQIAESGLGKTLDKAKNTGELCPYLCSINVYWNGISLEKVKEAKFTEDDKVKYRLQRGDLLICEGGDVGRSAIWDSDEEMYYQNALHRVRFYGHVLPQYFKMVIECYKGIGIIDEYSKGMTIKHLVQNLNMKNYLQDVIRFEVICFSRKSAQQEFRRLLTQMSRSVYLSAWRS